MVNGYSLSVHSAKFPKGNLHEFSLNPISYELSAMSFFSQPPATLEPRTLLAPLNSSKMRSVANLTGEPLNPEPLNPEPLNL